ncbi:GumC family protein [Pseudaminobacter soli (ex Zhang et al. 2022)]|uniref:GumC family protein n=1 Tax=Pseudaminobacter soli (ex Zhang et al. 2022) TaxID=2831468 RepID=UPI001F03119E|nr:GumC family protein [Pseudaminobacter soli]
MRANTPSLHLHSTQSTSLPLPGAAVVSESEVVSPPGGGIWQPLIDPAVVLRGIVRSRLLILASTVAGALIGVMVALNTPKQYYAAAELLADPRDLNLVERELTQSGISNEATLAIVENQVRILTSGTVISKVIDRLNLAQDPEFNGQDGGLSLRGLLSSLLSRSDGNDDPGRRYALAATNLHEKLNVQRGGKTFVIGVGVTTQDPEKSALIANTMTDVFLESYGQLQSNAAGRAATELNSKLDELRASVEAAERTVETFKAENDLIGAQGRLITDDEILKLNDQLATARAHTLELNARAASARSANANDVLTGSLPEELASPSMQELRAQYSALKGEVDRLSVRLGPRHPQLQALQSQLSGARSLIEAEIRRISGSIQTELKRAVQLEQELSSRLAQLKVRQGNLSNEMVTLRELERDATAKRAVYESFLLRARETGEQQGINSANISVISKAHPPLESEPPSRSTIVLASTFLGLLAGVGLGVVRGTAAGLRDRLSGTERTRLLRRRRRPVTMFDQDNPVETAGPSFAEPVEGRRSQPLQSVAGVPDAYLHHSDGALYAAAAPGQPLTNPHPTAEARYRPHAMTEPPSPYPFSPAAAPAYRATEPRPAPRHQRVEPNASKSEATIEEIRSSLQECRDAIRELAEQRSRRRYF